MTSEEKEVVVNSNESLEKSEETVEALNDEANSSVEVKEQVEITTDSNKRWYILQCYSGQEYKVKSRIEKFIEDNVFKGKVSQIFIPEEETIEIKENKRIERTVKVYPGYVFVEMEEDVEIWFQLRKIPGVSKFIGPKNMPTPVTQAEILRVLRKTEEKVKKIEVDLEKGEVVKIISGPFRGYSGPIDEIYAEKGKLKALISIFGRETPVELDFNQVEKAIKH